MSKSYIDINLMSIKMVHWCQHTLYQPAFRQIRRRADVHSAGAFDFII